MLCFERLETINKHVYSMRPVLKQFSEMPFLKEDQR